MPLQLGQAPASHEGKVVVVVVPDCTVVVVVVVGGVVVVGVRSPSTLATNESTITSIAAASPVVVQPPFESSLRKDLVNFDCALEMPAASLAPSGFFWFLPKAFKKSAAFFPVAFAFPDLQIAAGSLPACTGMSAAKSAPNTIPTITVRTVILAPL
jgi:hypothetical protein